MCGVSEGDVVSLGQMGDGMSWHCSLPGLFKLYMQWQETRSLSTGTSTRSIHKCLPKLSSTLSVQHHDTSTMHNPDSPPAPSSQPRPGPSLFQNGTAETQAVFLPHFPIQQLSVLSPDKCSSTAELCMEQVWVMSMG